MQPDDFIGQRVEDSVLPVDLCAVRWFASEYRLPVLPACWSVSPIAVLHAPALGINVLTPTKQRAEKRHLGRFVRRCCDLANSGGTRRTEDCAGVVGGGSGTSGERTLELLDLGAEAFVLRQGCIQCCLGFR